MLFVDTFRRIPTELNWLELDWAISVSLKSNQYQDQVSLMLGSHIIEKIGILQTSLNIRIWLLKGCWNRWSMPTYFSEMSQKEYVNNGVSLKWETDGIAEHLSLQRPEKRKPIVLSVNPMSHYALVQAKSNIRLSHTHAWVWDPKDWSPQSGRVVNRNFAQETFKGTKTEGSKSEKIRPAKLRKF